MASGTRSKTANPTRRKDTRLVGVDVYVITEDGIPHFEEIGPLNGGGRRPRSSGPTTGCPATARRTEANRPAAPPLLLRIMPYSRGPCVYLLMEVMALLGGTEWFMMGRSSRHWTSPRFRVYSSWPSIKAQTGLSNEAG